MIYKVKEVRGIHDHREKGEWSDNDKINTTGITTEDADVYYVHSDQCLLCYICPAREKYIEFMRLESSAIKT
jgi:NAD-dependent dihydropyrimidine dehydrogenase PreA subunit